MKCSRKVQLVQPCSVGSLSACCESQLYLAVSCSRKVARPDPSPWIRMRLAMEVSQCFWLHWTAESISSAKKPLVHRVQVSSLERAHLHPIAEEDRAGGVRTAHLGGILVTEESSQGCLCAPCAVWHSTYSSNGTPLVGTGLSSTLDLLALSS